jgi:hypothetical protein
LLEQGEECLVSRLVASESEAAAFRHICHHLDGPAEIGVRMPRRRKSTEVRLDQAFPLGDLSP